MEWCCKGIEWVCRVVTQVVAMVDVLQGEGRDDQLKEVYRIRAHEHDRSNFSNQVASLVKSEPLSFPSSSASPVRVPYQ